MVPCFIVWLMTILVLIGMVFVIIWEMFHRRIPLNSWLLLLLVNFGQVQVGIDIYIYIRHRKYQVKPHSSPWFSAACAAAIVHRNHFFHLYQQNKSSESKVNFRQLVIIAKGFLMLPNLHMLLKQRVHHFPETWLSGLLVNC